MGEGRDVADAIDTSHLYLLPLYFFVHAGPTSIFQNFWIFYQLFQAAGIYCACKWAPQ